jgi:predicted nucleotidyltransferase
MMQPTPYAHINAMLDELLNGMQIALGEKLVGLYLYGSLASGDFDDTVSDIDLLAATAEPLNEADFAALDRMHQDFVREHPERADRVEIAYLSLRALQTFKTELNPIGIMSPGEPFHIIEMNDDWLVNWHMVREIGVTLFGPPPRSIIVPTTQAEFVGIIKKHMVWWKDYIDEGIFRRPSQAYAIITMCRALYTVTHGEQVSKVKAAEWAQVALPEWAGLIGRALQWRLDWAEKDVDDESTLAETRRFVHFVIGEILR